MSQVKRSNRFEFVLSDEELELFETNFKMSGLSSKAKFIRSLITTLKVPCKLDKYKLTELKRLVSAIGKQNGLLKIYVLEVALTDFYNNRVGEILEDNEKIKNEIKELIRNLELELGFIYGS